MRVIFSGLLVFVSYIAATEATVTEGSITPGLCWKTIKTPRVRTVPKQVPTQERYLDYECYYRTWQKYNCYKFRQSFKYEYVIEDYIEDERIPFCCDGYESDIHIGIGNYSGDPHCKPICDKECIYSTCVSPNLCQCSPGYVVLNASEPNICEPHCDVCVNGVCSSPNVCDCNEGYTASTVHDNYCSPTCTLTCVNAQCTEPDTCSCDSGYIRVNETHCAPVCSQLCQGTCTAPEVCTCNEDHHQINNTHCVPKCSLGCSNGICSAPEVCDCFENYEKVDESTCRPTCKTPCGNSHCTDVDVCTCYEGYNKINASFCSPVCSSPCINGLCVAPDHCFCNSGFQIVNSTYCEPHCEKCYRGTCVAPNVCQCEQGYIYNNETEVCERVCKEVCTNGTCHINQCMCQEGDQNPYCIIPCEHGHKLNPITRHCQPVCQNCAGGYCLQPNVCSCPYNEHLVNSTCVVNESYKRVYATLYELYIRQELFLSCKSEMWSNVNVNVDTDLWGLEKYELMRCNSTQPDISSNTFPCIEECDLELVDKKKDVVSIKCHLYDQHSRKQKYGSIECTTSNLKPQPQSSKETSASPELTTDSPTTVVPERKVFYNCLNVIICVKANNIVRVYIGYFVSESLVPQETHKQSNVTDDKGTFSFPLLCPSEHERTVVKLLDGTQLSIPVISCEKEPCHRLSIETIHKHFLPIMYASIAIVCLVLVAIGIKKYIAWKRVFYVKSEGDGALESEGSDEMFRLSCDVTEE